MPAHLTAGQLAILRTLADFRRKRRRWPSLWETMIAMSCSRQSATVLFGKLIRAGLVVVDVKPLVHTRYRLTDKGRAAIGAGVQMRTREAP